MAVRDSHDLAKEIFEVPHTTMIKPANTIQETQNVTKQPHDMI